MKSFTAQMAKAITDENVKGPVIEPYIDVLVQAIRDAAKRGESSIDPWRTLSTSRLSSNAYKFEDHIRRHFITNGFKWEDHPNPDPGHPASSSYTTLSW